MKCFTCKESIDPKVVQNPNVPMGNGTFLTAHPTIQPAEYYSLTLSNHSPLKVFFHKECFETNASDEFGKALQSTEAQRLCVLCNEAPRKYEKGQKYLTCEPCSKAPTPCEHCNGEMIVRESRKTLSMFWGCKAWPNCRNARTIV